MIELIVGPMFSGKTTTLISRLERASIAKKSVLLIRPVTDTRKFLTHGNKNFNFNSKIDVIMSSDLLKVNTDTYDVVGIDEGQFHKHLKKFCIEESKKNKKIYIAALNATSEQKMFKEIIDIFPFCEIITKLNAVCMKTGDDMANYTHCLCNDKNSDILVGNTNEYEALSFSAAEEFFEEDKID